MRAKRVFLLSPSVYSYLLQLVIENFEPTFARCQLQRAFCEPELGIPDQAVKAKLGNPYKLYTPSFGLLTSDPKQSCVPVVYTGWLGEAVNYRLAFKPRLDC